MTRVLRKNRFRISNCTDCVGVEEVPVLEVTVNVDVVVVVDWAR